MLAVGSNFNGPRGCPTPTPERFDLMVWDPEAFLRLDGQAICVVGSGSASGLEGKLIVPLGVVLVLLVLAFRLAMAWREGDGDGEGSERRPAD